MASKTSDSKQKDVLARRQQLLEKLQNKIIEKLQKSDLDEILREYNDESIVISSNIILDDNEHGQLSILCYTGTRYAIPSPCPCGTQYKVYIEGEAVMKDCPCP